MLSKEEARRAGIALAAERLVTERGLGDALMASRRLYRDRDELAWFATRARAQACYLGGLDAAARRLLGAA